VRIARIGLTGGIAEGKSTVLGYLREFGLQTASADDAARAVFDQIQPVLGEILELPTPIDRSAMRQKITQDFFLRRRVNAAMHGPIVAWLAEASADVVEVPLLIEACLMSSFEKIWVVTCGPDEQLRRLSERLGSEESARQMIATQLPSRVKIAFADTVIRTDHPADHVKNFARLLVSA
jgi:dephospho-CoA kinase